ncbi:MAG: hypothetical protein HXY18_06910 [Bryobacteraceae bacterium]|nr:hypothetical protein [Bryobacteraceae bacterium]
MRIGTKSLLFGVHAFHLHWLLVAVGFWRVRARKHVALINGESQNLITSLSCSRSVLDEAGGLNSLPGYWRYLSERVRRLERQWTDPKPTPRQRAGRG